MPAVYGFRMNPCWEPFRIIGLSKDGDPAPKASHPRPVETPEGVGDRMRAAAFAELQAQIAFAWAADHFLDAPVELRESWRKLAIDEERHLNWILARMKDLEIDPAGRPVSDRLWQSLQACKTARDFAHYIANAEERGRQAGLRFCEALKNTDPMTEKIFRKIVEEEIDHVALAKKFYGNSDTSGPC